MFQLYVMSFPTGMDGVHAREGVTVDCADVDVLEDNVVDVLDVEVVRGDDVEEMLEVDEVDVLVSVVDESVVRDVPLVVEEKSLLVEETSVVVESDVDKLESVVKEESVVEEEKPVLIVVDNTDDEVEDELEEELEEELESTARLV